MHCNRTKTKWNADLKYPQVYRCGGDWMIVFKVFGKDTSCPHSCLCFSLRQNCSVWPHLPFPPVLSGCVRPGLLSATKPARLVWAELPPFGWELARLFLLLFDTEISGIISQVLTFAHFNSLLVWMKGKHMHYWFN